MIYECMFIICAAIIVAQFALAMLGADLDIDFDADGNIDVDGGSIISFKGIIHFLLGFSAWLAGQSRFVGTITPSDYLIAVGIGVVFTVALYYLYKALSKLSNEIKPESLIGKTAYVTVKLSENFYSIKAIQNGAYREFTAYSETDYEVGDKAEIISENPIKLK